LALERDGPSRLFHFTNRFLQLDGQDFSTSRGHAVWIRDASAKYPVDAVRLYAGLHAPEDEVKSFRLVDFENWIREWYVPQVAHGTWKRTDARRAAVLPKTPYDLGGDWSVLFKDWTTATKLETFSISKLASVQLRAAALIEAAPLDQHDVLWLLYAHLGEAVHPRLSQDIVATLPERRSEALELFSKLNLDGMTANKASYPSLSRSMVTVE
jgi:methionyl-tRNA synthetase